MKILRQSVCFALLCILVSALAGAMPAHANEPGKKLSRNDLMGLAKQFVSRVGGKLEQTETPPTPTENILDRYDEDTVLYFQIRLMPDRIDLERQVASVKHGNSLMVSFSDFAAATDFAISVSPADKRANGWFIREDNLFSMDVATHTVRSGNKTYEIGNDDLLINDTDIYVRAETLATWLNFQQKTNIESLRFDVTPPVSWPIQERIKRERNKGFFAENRKPPSLPPLDDPYKTASIPNATVQSKTVYTNPKDAKSELTTNYTTQLAGDIAGHTGKLRISGDKEEKISNVQMQLYKDSDKSDLLGPLKARHYEVGDISPVIAPLINGAGTEVGARVSNKDPYITYDTNVQITGDATPGWDVELFRENQYLATVTVDEGGRYIFDNVSLFAKDNNFRIVQYGPQGEIREETKTYRVDSDLYENGKGLYDISTSLTESQIYRKHDTEDEDKNTPHLAANYERQLTDNLAGRVGTEIRQEEGDQKAYLHGGLVGTYNNTIVNADTAVQNEGAFAAGLTARHRANTQNITAKAQYFSEDYNPGSDVSRPAEYVLGAQIGGSIPLAGFKPSYNYETEYSARDDGSHDSSNSLNLSANIGRITLGNTLLHTTDSENDDEPSRTSDIFTVRGYALGLSMRATTEYEIQPDPGVVKYETELTKLLNKDWQTRLKFEHEVDPNYSKGEVLVDWRGKHALVSPSISYDSEETMTAMLNVKTGLTKNPYGETIIRGETLSDKGGVAAFVFLDKNGDNVFNEGEERLQDVRIKALHANRNADTDEKGEAFIYNIPDNRVTDVFVDEQSFTDPYWVSGTQGVSIRPRAGHVSRIEFPIHLAGEMDGTVYSLTENGTQNTVSNLRLALIDKDGKVSQNTITDADGFYWFTKISPGKYTLAVDGEDARAKKLQTPLPQTIEIGFDGPILNGRNIMMDHNDHPAAIINIASLDKLRIADPAFDEAKLGESKVLLNLGTYKSNLMMGLSWYKISFFNGKALAGASPLVNPTDSYPATRTGLHTLRALVPNDSTEAAYQRCLLLSANGYDCTVEILPSKPAEQIIGMR